MILPVLRIERVPLRTVWPREEYDFTPWLQANIDVLNEVIEMTIADVEREQSAGTFSVDLVGQDEHGKTVVIENQFGKSDHDHLGKLMTYLTAFEATTGIWIVEQPRPEHIAVITWLNQSTPSSFYLIKVEAIRIGDSAAAPLLTRIVGPSIESREVGVQKQEMAERQSTLWRFWETLLSTAKTKTPLHANVSPSRDHWLNAGAGRSGLAFTYIITRAESRVEFTMDLPDATENKRIFDRLSAERESIDEQFGSPLNWLRLDERKSSKVVAIVGSGYLSDEHEWPSIQQLMVDAMIRLERAFRPHIERLST